MMRTRKDWLALAAAVLLFAALVAVCKTVLCGAAFVEAVVALDHRDRLQVFYAGSEQFSEHHSAFSAMIEPGQPQTVRIPLHGAAARKLRLDLGNQPGTVRLFKLTVAGTLAADRVLAPEDIQRLFSSQSPETTVRVEQDHLAIQTSEDSWLACETALLRPSPLLLWGLPLLFTLLAFGLLQQTEISGLAPFSDLRSKRPSTGENINALDGLRALAVLMVIADHTWGRFSGLGTSGVWIFMTLSGFLLAKPFIQQPERAASLSYLRHFFVRRIQRIVPVYYTYVVIVFLLSGHLVETALHLLFLKVSGHLWVVPQEMCFYLLTPPLMLLCCQVLRGKPLLVIPALLVLLLLSNQFLTKEVIALYGMDDIRLRLYFGAFLSGILASWFYHGLWQVQDRQGLQRRIEPWAAGLVITLLLFFLLCSEAHLWGGHLIYTQIYFPWFSAAAALLILAVLAAGQSAATRFLASTPLRALSLVSFSVYIFHPLLLEVIRKGAEQCWGISHLSGGPLFLATVVCSYLFACFSYSLIERPFLRSGTA